MTQAVLKSMLTHRCDFQKATRGVADEGSYGHEEVNYSPPETILANVQCLMQALSVDELASLGMVGTVRGMYALFLLFQDIPPALTMHAGLYEHQVANVRFRLSNAVIDAGPFDIVSVDEQAGQGHHYRLTLQRVS